MIPDLKSQISYGSLVNSFSCIQGYQDTIILSLLGLRGSLEIPGLVTPMSRILRRRGNARTKTFIWQEWTGEISSQWFDENRKDCAAISVIREWWWDGAKSHRRRQWHVPAYHIICIWFWDDSKFEPFIFPLFRWQKLEMRHVKIGKPYVISCRMEHRRQE